jgi:hypothetical protein
LSICFIFVSILIRFLPLERVSRKKFTAGPFLYVYIIKNNLRTLISGLYHKVSDHRILLPSIASDRATSETAILLLAQSKPTSQTTAEGKGTEDAPMKQAARFGGWRGDGDRNRDRDRTVDPNALLEEGEHEQQDELGEKGFHILRRF